MEIRGKKTKNKRPKRTVGCKISNVCMNGKCVFECERWQSACRSTGTGRRAGVLLCPVAVPGHTATLCQRCPPLPLPASPLMSLIVPTFLSTSFTSQFISTPYLVLFPSFCFHSPLLPLNELNPAATHFLLHLHCAQTSWRHFTFARNPSVIIFYMIS